jgi:2-keto-4-pentenoate hydratase/2-oxohepta-3-ene-1,7-dioic acid hydratase in catechol pathway
MKLARGRFAGASHYGEVDGEMFYVLSGDLFGGRARTGESVPLGDVVLESPVQPGKLLIVLGGFLAEGATLPPGTTPRLTAKVVSSVGGDGHEVLIPPFVTTRLWIESELAIVIGRGMRNVSPDEAREGILGFTCFGDFTAPEFIYDVEAGKSLSSPDHFRAKSIETFAAMGPWIETGLTEDDFRAGLKITAHLNGELGYEGTTRLQKFLPSEFVSHASQQLDLSPGDVIALGTPNICYGTSGDSVEIAVEGIGSLHSGLVSINAVRRWL